MSSPPSPVTGSSPPEPVPPDRQLVARCLSGDQEAYRAMVDRYQDRAFWTAYKLVQNEDDAADVTQDAFVKAFAMLHTFDVNRAFFTWMYRVVVNVAIDHLRRRDARPASSLEGVGEFIPDGRVESPTRGIELEETQARVAYALEHLHEPYRSVLVLADVEGHSCKAIGEMIDVPHATVRWRLHHARKLFKDVWERRFEKEEVTEGD